MATASSPAAPALQETTPLPEEWMTAREAFASLGIAERTLRKWAVAGRITRQFGPDGRPRYRTTDVRRLLSEPNTSPTGTASPSAKRRRGPKPRLAPAAIAAPSAIDPSQSPAEAWGSLLSAAISPLPAGEGTDRLSSPRPPAQAASPRAENHAEGAFPTMEAEIAQLRAREEQLCQENAWLRERLQVALQAAAEFCTLLLNDAQRSNTHLTGRSPG